MGCEPKDKMFLNILMFIEGREFQALLPSLKLTARALENRPGPKRKRSYSNHPFSGGNLLLVSGRETNG